MNAMDIPLELIENTAEHVILRNHAKSNLEMARFPELSGGIDYITITKGRNHTLTTIMEDGTASSFDWGTAGYPCIGPQLKARRDLCMFFLGTKLIMMDVRTLALPTDVDILLNPNFGVHGIWQIEYRWPDGRNQNVFTGATDVESAMDEARRINPDLVFGKTPHPAPTGIPVWSGHAELIEQE